MKAPIGGRGADDIRARLRSVTADRSPEQRRTLLVAGAAALVALGLVLPPVSILTRVRSIGYTRLRPGVVSRVSAEEGAAYVDFDRFSLQRTSRAKLDVRSTGDVAEVAKLPPGRELISDAYAIDFNGPVPRRGTLTVPIVVTESDRPFVDPYGWDGERWEWLSPQFATDGTLGVRLPLDRLVPRWVVVTKAGDQATEVAAALLPPPAAVPAAAAELPVLELRGFRLADGDGSIGGEAFPVPSREARRLAVVENTDGRRIRSDLLDNMLIRPESRRRHREALVDLVERQDLDGIVLDYRGAADDLQPVYVDFVRRLADDLHRRGAELVVMVPFPARLPDGWNPGSANWRELGAAADGVRVPLPSGTPLDVEAMDDMVRWALTQVERGRLQLSVPVEGRDIVGDENRPISFGRALGQILDMARSDAPARIAPGESRAVELPSLRAAELARDPGTGMWRFHYWDENRRQHTVWLNDAVGLKPAFDIAGRYRLGRIVLDGVEAGLDPGVWRLARQFSESGDTSATRDVLRLQWQLVDESGRVVQEAIQPLDEASFGLQAPRGEGRYHLTVNLVDGTDTIVALGSAAEVAVAPPPPPTPKPTVLLIYIEPTPVPYATAPAPADEASLRRTPVRITQAAATATPSPFAARLAAASAEVRDAPGVYGARLGDLRAGDVLELIGRNASATWLLVRLGSTGVEGWVLADLLAFDIDPLRLPDLAATPPPGPTGTP